MSDAVEFTHIYQEVLDILGSMESEAEQRLKRMKIPRIEKDNLLQMISEHCDDVQSWLEEHFDDYAKGAEENPEEEDPEEQIKKLPKGDPFPSAKDTLYDA